MSKTRFVFLLSLVILAGGGTIWIAFAAAEVGKLNGQTMMAILPLVMLVSIAARGLAGRKNN